MDPLYEQRLRDEVIFLHSLWYQGPPRPLAAARYSLRPSKSIHFKNDQNRGGKSGNIFSNNATHDSSSSHDAVWPYPPNPPPPTAWPASCGPTPDPVSLSAEQLNLAAKGADHPALNADGFDEIDSSDGDDDEDCSRTTATIACTSASVPIPRHHLQPSEATKFKKKHKKRKGKSGNILAKNAVTESNSSHGAEWPCPSPPHLPSTSGWPTTGWATSEKSSLKPVLLSSEEQSILAARHAHQHALKVVHEFFRTNNSNDSDEIDSGSDDVDDDDDDDELMEEYSGSEEYSFFLKVFEEDTKLRECYVKNFVEGEFSCLICGAVGWKKSGKKFKGCLPLLQHLIAITKTKKRKAHRAFGRAVCNVLGWDIDRLPTIESMLSDKTSETQISLTCADANKNLENPGMVCQQIMEEPASLGLTTNSLVGPVADNNENLGVVHQVEQSASEWSEINSLVGPNADNYENLRMLHQMEKPASEGSKINSLVGPNADNNENLGILHQMEQPASEGSKINSLVGPDVDNGENLGEVHQVEQPASESSNINSLEGPDADNNECLGTLHQMEQPASESQ